jgi:hypothetical protein
MVSLYVCDFPQDIDKSQLSAVFQAYDGYIETRTARDRSGQKIAFVDYTDKEKALTALQRCAGFRFEGSTKGITLRLSENSKTTKQSSDHKKQPSNNPPKGILKSSSSANPGV